jgi:DNA-binding beta-propeller fold protein YncE
MPIGKRGLAFFLMAVVVGVAAARGAGIPHYKNDASWPKPFPNHWVIGQIGGLFVDSSDHIWVLQRPLPYGLDDTGVKQTLGPAMRMPSVLEFDTAGDILKSWGGQGYVPDWPKSEHALWLDAAGNVWIGGNAPGDRQVLKFTPDGKQLLEIGHPTKAPRNNQDTSMLGQPAGIAVDDAAHEVYIADGYLNNRIVVYDSDTGKFKRGWGTYGIPLGKIVNAPEPPPTPSYVPEGPAYVPGEPPEKQFRTPVHCVRISEDGIVYVCDRRNDRIQLFTKQGKFLREFLLHRETRGYGSVWILNFSRDPQQKYLLVGDGVNQRIWVIDRRTGVEKSSFGEGYLHTVHQAGLDSHGNYYSGDVGFPEAGATVQGNGKTIQKFVLQ